VDGGSKKFCDEKDKDTKCFLCEKELCNAANERIVKTFPILLFTFAFIVGLIF
jgi:hypothetical protein